MRTLQQFQGAEYQQALDELVDLLDVRAKLNVQVRELSLGERMKCEIAAGLLSLGFAPGQTASILSNTVIEWVLADLAVLSCGGVSNGIYPTDAAAQCEYLLADSGSVFVFVEDDEQLESRLRGGTADLVLSDMAPSATGHPQTDHLRIMHLVETAFAFAQEVLAPGGFFVAKVLQGGTEGQLLTRLKRDFATVRHVKPAASRADSGKRPASIRIWARSASARELAITALASCHTRRSAPPASLCHGASSGRSYPGTSPPWSAIT